MPGPLQRRLEGVVRNAPVLSPACIEYCLLSLLADAHDNCWFFVDGASSVSRTCKGSKQGDPLGDAIYNLTAIRISPQVRER
eukprot:8263434-Alexandrium_andersonii.AAC.1